MMGTLAQDLRYALRMLAKSPAFTLVAVASLAIGIGANTAIFSLANAVLFRPANFEDPSRLVNVNGAGAGAERFAVSYPAYQYYRDHNEAFAGLLCWGELPLSLTRGQLSAEQSFGMIVSGNYFEVLGARPALGRFFLAEEDRVPGASAVAVISYGLWQRDFGADPAAIGQQVNLNGTQFTIVGVAPKGFTSSISIYAPDVWVPVMMQGQVLRGGDMLNSRNAEWLSMTGRLKPSVSAEQAEAEMSLLSKQLEDAYPEVNRSAEGEPEKAKGLGVKLTPVGQLPRKLRGALIGFTGLLLAVVGLVLLIACANLSSLLLARATERRKEIAVRLALGARRWRIVRQLLTESVLLCILSGAVGLVFAMWMSDLLLAFKPDIPLPLELEPHLDVRVFTWACALSLVTGVIFGLLPALQASKTDLISALKDEPGSRGYRKSRLRDLFVTGQVAMSLLLLVSAGLFLRALNYAQTIYPGRDPQEVLTVTLDPHLLGYDVAKSREFYRQLTERVRALPGVESVGLAEVVPVGPSHGTMCCLSVEGQKPAREEDGFEIENNFVSPQYLATMKIPLKSGRDFSDADREGAPQVAIIDEVAARRIFASTDPLGQRFTIGKMKYEIIGVAEAGRSREADREAAPFIYFPLAQKAKEFFNPRLVLHVRTKNDAQTMFAALRREVAALDANLPLQNTMPLTEYIHVALLPQRIVASVATAFGMTGLLLAALGIFGLMSYTVAQRTHEIGVRMALGAQSADVLKMILRRGLKIALIGVGLGLIGALLVTRLLTSLLYGVSATDPLTFAGVALLLAIVALVASYIPARRAAKVDPMVALRYE